MVRTAADKGTWRALPVLLVGMWVFRTNVTGDFGIVTADFGAS